MAHIYVTSDDETIRVTITSDDEGAHSAVCSSCGRELVAGTHEQYSTEDTVETAAIHVDHQH